MFSERINIGVVSPYKEFAKTATSVADKLGVAIDIKDVELEKLEEVIRKWEEEGIIEAIVARSAGASLMKRLTPCYPLSRWNWRILTWRRRYSRPASPAVTVSPWSIIPPTGYSSTMT